jgi:hypothetical protein
MLAMKHVATVALAALTGCAVYSAPPRDFRHLSNFRLPLIPYAAYPTLPAPTVYQAATPPLGPGLPGPTAAALPPSEDPRVYHPYSDADMAAGIAEATGFAALIAAGVPGPPAPGMRGGRLPDFSLNGPDIDTRDKPEPYNCGWGYASMGTCVAPLK